MVYNLPLYTILVWNMDNQYQQFDFQILIDLLAEETELYTRAFISGKVQDTARHKAIIDSLVAEIKHRKQEASLPPFANIQPPSNQHSGA
jgi:hypothetical protein